MQLYFQGSELSHLKIKAKLSFPLRGDRGEVIDAGTQGNHLASKRGV